MRFGGQLERVDSGDTRHIVAQDTNVGVRVRSRLRTRNRPRAVREMAYIKSHAGERLDQIAKGLGVPTKDLKLPAQKLFAQKAIKTTGVKRGTVYFVR